MDDTGRVLARAHELAQEFVADLDERPVWPRATFEEMLAAFEGPLPDTGADPRLATLRVLTEAPGSRAPVGRPTGGPRAGRVG